MVNEIEDRKIAEKRQDELKTVELMIRIFCRGKHGNRKDELCSECSKLMEYVRKRVQCCPMMKEKTFCSVCKVHCYRPQEREKIREVMRYSGPRMLIYSPMKAIRHILTEFFYDVMK